MTGNGFADSQARPEDQIRKEENANNELRAAAALRAIQIQDLKAHNQELRDGLIKDQSNRIHNLETKLAACNALISELKAQLEAREEFTPREGRIWIWTSGRHRHRRRAGGWAS